MSDLPGLEYQRPARADIRRLQRAAERLQATRNQAVMAAVILCTQGIESALEFLYKVRESERGYVPEDEWPENIRLKSTPRAIYHITGGVVHKQEG